MDDLKPTDDSAKKPVSQPGDQPTDSQINTPEPSPPDPAPTSPSVPPAVKSEKPPEPSPQTVPTQTTVATKEPSPLTPKPAVTKPPGKKLPSAIKVGGALILLLMAAVLPATVILVQNRTTLAPKAEEEAITPTARSPGIAETYIFVAEGDLGSELVQPVRPHDVKIESISSESAKITFIISNAYPSIIRYSPDDDWNFLTMIQEEDIGDEWRERYHDENEEEVEPVGGSRPSTEHEYTLENLASNQKYYFSIGIEKPEENTIYWFGLDQPERHYTFLTE